MSVNCMFHYKQPVKLAMPVLVLLPLLLLSYGVGNIHCSNVHDNSVDRQALLDFKKGVTSDPNGALNNWTMSSHFCRWNGVTCTLKRRPLRVVWLILTGEGLSGQISSSLGNLTFLNTLDLSDNNFFGPLPILGGLQQLQDLYLNNNNLSGIIPDALTNCSNLTYLDISSNSLVGSISPKFGLLSNLVSVSLAENQLEGSIPSDLGRLRKLEYLVLGRNRISGEIPHSIFSLSSLKSLGLENNMLDKATLPPNIGELFPNLTQLTLENNSFEGPIPASLGNALRLEVLDLSLNNFSGKIPTSLGKLRNLTVLNLQNNQLIARNNQDWEFLNALRNCRYLNYLGLAHNELQGPIPLSISNLSTSLQFLLLSGNSLSGEIPWGIGNLTGLVRLGLSGNYFSGATEVWIRNFKSLRVLYIQSNNFSGPIPSFNNSSQLVYLDISENEFEGSIPASLGNFRGLQYLYVSYNNLQGYIPPNFGNLEQLILFDLSHNNLQGDITLDISKFKQLTDLHISSNKFTGEIPDTFGKCLQLETLLIDQNDLIGNIPTSLKGLQSLKTLNLSHNNLSGTIPTSLEDLPFLNKLDLSYNHLQGEIPMNGVFANATAISLNGNWGFCGGVMDLHMPACPAVSRVIEWKHYLTILLIIVFGFMSLGTSIYALFLGKKAPRRPYLLLLSFGKKFPRVSYKDLAQATENFSEFNLVGRGSYGSVYRGKLTQAKIEVAIKVFDLETRFADKSFISECESLKTIRHRNLLPILTSCPTVDNNGNDFKALIYEFMRNGNLDTWLHKKRGGVARKLLGLAQRLSIGVGMADALAYLHHDCQRPIIHCDLKPTNILLDDDMNAHLGDFGIASLIVDSRSIAIGYSSGCSSSLSVRGTIGYIAPEYAQTVHVSTCGDVYSFGILLLEIIIGKRPTDSMFEDGLSITSFVEKNFPDQVLHIIDPHLQEECKGFIKSTAVETENGVYRCVLSLVQVALACTRPLPRERMNMREVAINLHAIRKSYAAAIK